MKCKQCNSDVKESKFNTLTGYKSYRCISCNALYDISDLEPTCSRLDARGFKFSSII